MMRSLRTVVLLGLPGTGKGTLGKAVGTLPEFVHVEAGAIFRDVSRHSAAGERVHQHLERGELVPDDLALEIWSEHLREAVEAGDIDADRDVVLSDGMPRTRVQAKQLTTLVDVVHVLHLACDDEEELVRRLRGRGEEQGRADDANEQLIRQRIDLHRSQINAVLSHYPPQQVTTIDACCSAVQSLADVAAALVRVLEKTAAR